MKWRPGKCSSKAWDCARESAVGLDSEKLQFTSGGALWASCGINHRTKKAAQAHCKKLNAKKARKP